MPRSGRPFDDDDSREDWELGPEDEESWEEEPEDEECLIPCPNCGSLVYDDAPMCPVCNEVLGVSSGSYLSTKPTWYVALAILGIGAVILGVLFSF